MRRAALYARVSTEEQTNNFSIDNQLDHLRKVSNEKGYTATEEYVDGGFSGTTMNRPAFTKLMEDCRSGEISIVFVYKLDRLFRNSRHIHNVLYEWENLGTKFTSITEAIDTSTAMGKAYLGMASTFAELERNTFIERSRDGMKKAVQSGRYSGGIVAYGYQYNPDTKQVDVNEEEAEVIRKIYHWVVEDGMTTYGIAKQLNVLGIPTRYAKDKRGIRGRNTANVWDPSRICNMVHNTAYKGQWTYGKRSKNKLTDPIVTECPSIVDAETWEKAQVKLRENRLWSDRNSKRVYPLRGLIKCELCGHSYCGGCYNTKARGEVRTYRCDRNGLRGGKKCEGCKSATIPAELLEDLVWQHISDFVRKPKTVRKMIEKRLHSQKTDDCKAEIDDLEKRMREFTESEIRVLRLYADPKNRFSKEALDSQMEDIAQARDLVDRRIGELREVESSEIEQNRRLENIDDTLRFLRNRLKNITPEMKQEIMQNLVSGIQVGKDEDGITTVAIVYAFDDQIADSMCYNSDNYDEGNLRLQDTRMSMRIP